MNIFEADDLQKKFQEVKEKIDNITDVEYEDSDVEDDVEDDVLDKKLKSLVEKAQKVKTDNKNKKSPKISGKILLTIMNAVYPNVLLFIMSKISDKYSEIDAEKIRLSKSELDNYQDLADVVADEISSINPTFALFLLLSIEYYIRLDMCIKMKEINDFRIEV